MVRAMSFGWGEIVVLGFVLLVVLSASRMGALGNALGRFVYSYKQAARGQDTIDVTPRGKLPSEEEDAELVDEPRK